MLHLANLSPIDRIVVEVERARQSDLRLGFRAQGEMTQTVWPEAPNSKSDDPWVRADELWRHSCFELFVAVEDRPGYVEINLSPSNRWAAYCFSAYRERMVLCAKTELLAADCWVGERHVELNAVLTLPPAFAGVYWWIGLSAVVEASDGTLSYWALRHPPGKPDFHHPDCFALELPAPEGA